MVLRIYQNILRLSPPILRGVLAWREFKGKEDPARLRERRGYASLPRPEGKLVWIHAASVGEAQSALILIDKLAADHILMTSGTVTSANYLRARLPARAMHQYIPLDTPRWVARFLDHWRPDLVLWMESELWPNMLGEIKRRAIPAALVNARLSERSYKRWQMAPQTIKTMLGAFSVILAQTWDAEKKYKALGAQAVYFTDNIKYSAAPLPCDHQDLQALQSAIGTRPCWVYASTHDGEEQLASRIHERLKQRFPDLLTIIVPRHPDRRAQIAALIGDAQLRGPDKTPPASDTGIYIADTMGELGLFYRAAPIAMIGRSFSADGGGGHNPIEAAQLNCAVLSGPYVQFQQEIFDDMVAADAARLVTDDDDLYDALMRLLDDKPYLTDRQEKAALFAARKSAVIDTVMARLSALTEASL